MTRPRRTHNFRLALLLLLASATLCLATEIPPRPADYLLDQAGVFSPETAHRLVDALKAAARDHDVHIYVLTVPTLKVMPSHTREKLEEIRVAAEQSWFNGEIGALIIFDDESGWITMGVSAEAQRRFSTVAINLAFMDPEFEPTLKRLTPKKLETTTMALASHFIELKIKTDEEERRQWTKRIVFSVTAFLGLLLGGAGRVFRKRPAPVAPERETTAISS